MPYENYSYCESYFHNTILSIDIWQWSFIGLFLVMRFSIKSRKLLHSRLMSYSVTIRQKRTNLCVIDRYVQRVCVTFNLVIYLHPETMSYYYMFKFTIWYKHKNGVIVCCKRTVQIEMYVFIWILSYDLRITYFIYQTPQWFTNTHITYREHICSNFKHNKNTEKKLSIKHICVK